MGIFVMKRATTASIEILTGADILSTGMETARRLWNYTCWCTFGYNNKLRRQRGDSFEQFKRNLPHARGTKYLGNFGMQKELKDYWGYRNLSDRCASYTVRDFDIAMKSWFSNLKNNPDARPPRYCKTGRTLNFEVGRNAKPVGNFEYKLTVLGG